MKRYSIISLLIVIVLIFSGCSVTSLNNTLEGVTENGQAVVSQTTIGKYIESESEDTDNSTIESDAKPDNEKGIGESFDAEVNYETKEGVMTRGTTGLRYTLNAVEVFDNFFESGEDIDACGHFHNWDYENNCWGELNESGKRIIPINNFILIEMTATYSAPEDGKAEIDVRLLEDVYATYKNEKMPEGWFDEFIALREQNTPVMEPVMYWFSEPVLEDDGYNIVHDGFCFKLKDGESRTFKIGVYCWDKFIEYKNVYLSIQHFNPGTIDGYDGRYFAIFPEE